MQKTDHNTDVLKKNAENGLESPKIVTIKLSPNISTYKIFTHVCISVLLYRYTSMRDFIKGKPY
jgi:hypothetical protein